MTGHVTPNVVNNGEVKRDASQPGEQSLAPRESQHIVVSDLVAGFADGTIAVRGLSLEIAEGEHLSLLGPSGCGKTTTLRCIAGLERPLSGEIFIDGRAVFSSSRRINLPPEQRGLSMVFQSYAIWPHMTVFDNVAYGLRARRLSRQIVRTRVMEALELVGLESLAQNRATALSGGQQQRVALARSFAPRPKAMLLDEPLSNLDTRLRVRMRKELSQLQHSLGITTVYVTHDEEEAMVMSDRIVVMDKGRMCQVGTPADIYSWPQTSFVAKFVGGSNLYPGCLSQAGSKWYFDASHARIECRAPSDPIGDPAELNVLGIRSAHAQLSRDKPDAAVNVWPARITQRMWLGDVIEYTVGWGPADITVRALAEGGFDEDEEVFLHIPAWSAVPVRGLTTASRRRTESRPDIRSPKKGHQ